MNAEFIIGENRGDYEKLVEKIAGRPLTEKERYLLCFGWDTKACFDRDTQMVRFGDHTREKLRKVLDEH